MTDDELIRAYGMRPDQFDCAVRERADLASHVRAARVEIALGRQARYRPARLADRAEIEAIGRRPGVR